MMSFGLAVVLKATAALLLTLLAVRVARQASASVRHLILTAGFGVLLVLPIASVLAPSVRVEISPVAPAFEPYVTGTSALDETLAIDADASRATATAAPPHWVPLSREAFLTAIWLSGVWLFALPMISGLLHVRRLRREGLPWRDGQTRVDALARHAGIRGRVDVVVHESIAAPATCGIVRRTILFPPDARIWSEEDLLRAMVHEVEHVRRRDCLVHAMARAICAMYWWQPLVWFTWRRLGLEAERACDDAVLRRADDGTVYADQLVTLAGRLSGSPRHSLLAMANRGDLVRRVSAVLDPTLARGEVGQKLAASIVCGACAVAVAIAPLQAVSAVARHADEQGGDAVAPQQFDVATIRINRSGDLRARHDIVPASGRLTVTNATVSSLIQDAYDVQLPSQIVNMPDWARSQRVDVVARAASPVPVAVLQRMLQPLLAEYFKLRIRRETRELEVLALVVAKPGQLGPQLRRNDDDCDDAIGLTSGFSRAPETSEQRRRCGILPGGAGRIVALGLDMAGLADLLATAPRRVVIDRTGLTGRFDIDLTYTPEIFSAAALAQRPNPALPPGVDPAGPPLATALQEQLGLKFESLRAPVEVLVIEHAEPLSADSPAPGAADASQPLRFARPAELATHSVPAAFEVASVRRNTSGSPGSRINLTEGRFTATNVSLRQLILEAYRLQPLQIEGGPDWLGTARGRKGPGDTLFDVVATIEEGTPPASVPAMLRALLVERFRLGAHTEARKLPIFALVRARDDGKLGPNLSGSAEQCDAGIAAGGPLRAPATRVAADGRPTCGMTIGPARMRGAGTTMTQLAGALAVFTERVVVDRTGLGGFLDFELRFAPSGPGARPVVAVDPDAPSIFTALEEQLGLKLEASEGAVEVFVIDGASLPIEN